jgi:hypothetical protein
MINEAPNSAKNDETRTGEGQDDDNGGSERERDLKNSLNFGNVDVLLMIFADLMLSWFLFCLY